MVGFGDALLGLLGHTDPRKAAVAGMLGTPAPAARTPGMGLPMQATAAAPAPAQPQAYQSPADLVDLYSQLTDYASRERNINHGFGLMAASFAQPENRELIMNAAKGGEMQLDPLEMITKIQGVQQEQAMKQQAAAEKERQLATLPAIAEQYGLDPTTARMLFDSDQLDDFIMEKSKYHAADTSVVDTPDGKALIENATGKIVKQYGMPAAPPTDDMAELAAENKNRELKGQPPLGMQEWLDRPKTPDPTADMQNLEAANKDRARMGQPTMTMEEWILLGRPKAGDINIDLGEKADSALVSAFDKLATDEFANAAGGVNTIQKVQEARRALNASGGIVSGDLTAPVRLASLKVASDFFGLDSQAAENTEVFQAQMKELVLPKVKQLGTGNSISNADREFIEKAIGGSIELTEGAIRRILNIMERGTRNEILRANAKMEKRVSKSKNQAVKDAFMPIEAPELSEDAAMDLITDLQERAPGHIQLLLENPEDADAVRKFDAVHGAGAAQIILSRFQ